MRKNAQGTLVPFDTPLPNQAVGPDGPVAHFLQQISGQQDIFYIDGPGLRNLNLCSVWAIL